MKAALVLNYPKKYTPPPPPPRLGECRPASHAETRLGHCFPQVIAILTDFHNHNFMPPGETLPLENNTTKTILHQRPPLTSAYAFEIFLGSQTLAPLFLLVGVISTGKI